MLLIAILLNLKVRFKKVKIPYVVKEAGFLF